MKTPAIMFRVPKVNWDTLERLELWGKLDHLVLLDRRALEEPLDTW